MSGPIRTTLDALKRFADAVGLTLEQAADALDYFSARKDASPDLAAPGPTPASSSVSDVSPVVPTDPLIDLPMDGKAH